jgi:hypothetical protein
VAVAVAGGGRPERVEASGLERERLGARCEERVAVEPQRECAIRSIVNTDSGLIVDTGSGGS